jgi:hypothetical protein
MVRASSYGLVEDFRAEATAAHAEEHGIIKTGGNDILAE